jgi:hypothetical protein
MAANASKLNRRRWTWAAIILLALGGALWFWRSVGVHWIEPHPGRVDHGEKSTDLQGDRELMWETSRLGGTPDPSHGPNPRSSTDRAINAASRVFNSVELTGKSREEVIGILGDPKTSNDSIYNFPFWPPPKGALIYRFDTGAYGWQFNVVFDGDGQVREVQRRWIH